MGQKRRICIGGSACDLSNNNVCAAFFIDSTWSIGSYYRLDNFDCRYRYRAVVSYSKIPVDGLFNGLIISAVWQTKEVLILWNKNCLK
jgi:hypothetical protein